MSWNRLERIGAVTKFPCEPLTFINTRDSFLSDPKFTFLIWLVASFSCIGRGLLFCREKPGLLLSNWPCFFHILSHGLQKLWGQRKVIFLCTVLAKTATLNILAGLKSKVKHSWVSMRTKFHTVLAAGWCSSQGGDLYEGKNPVNFRENWFPGLSKKCIRLLWYSIYGN